MAQTTAEEVKNVAKQKAELQEALPKNQCKKRDQSIPPHMGIHIH